MPTVINSPVRAVFSGTHSLQISHVRNAMLVNRELLKVISKGASRHDVAFPATYELVLVLLK